MKIARNILLGVTGTLLLLFVISLFNVFQSDDTRMFDIKNHYEITMVEGEDEKRDEDYITYKIENVSGIDLYNNQFVFGVYTSDTHYGNYIWFRMAKISRADTITLKLYEDGYYEFSSKKSEYEEETVSVAIYPLAPEFDIEDCFKIHSVKVDSEEPEIKELALPYWSIEKILLLGFAILAGVATVVLHSETKERKEQKEK